MHPIFNQQFSDDFHKFVFQDQNVQPSHPPVKVFDMETIGKSKKMKKDLEKEKQKKMKDKGKDQKKFQ